MTVKELIEKLQEYPEDTRVYTWSGNYIREHQKEIEEIKYRNNMCVEVDGYLISRDNINGIYLS